MKRITDELMNPNNQVKIFYKLNSWYVQYIHPKIPNHKGDLGRNVEINIHTQIESEAQSIKNKIFHILNTPSLQDLQSNIGIEDPQLYYCYYRLIDEYKNNINDPDKYRDLLLPLPSADADVIFLGATGSGKTSLIRHVIGTDSLNFPLKSKSRATTSDMEIIIRDNSFRMVITFFPYPKINLLIKERVMDAIIASFYNEDLSYIFEKLKENKPQTFKLHHIIGNYSEDQKEAFVNRLLINILHFSKELKTDSKFSQILDNTDAQFVNEYPESFLDLIKNHQNFEILTKSILTYIQNIFNNVKIGFFQYDENGWPLYWEYEEDKQNKEILIKNSKRFTSNYYKNFGKLLTPLVSGIRIEGPFYSDFFPVNTKVVILRDGQGLGHEGDLDLALSIKTLDLLKRVDKIILVDNGEQPMIGLTLIALEQIFSRGLSSKLAIAFTRFDLIVADDLPSLKDRQNRLKNPILDSLNQIFKKNKSKTTFEFAKKIDEQVFFLGELHKPSDKITGFYKTELQKFCSFFFIKNEKELEEIIPPLNPIKEKEILIKNPKQILKIDYQILRSFIDLQYTNYFQDFGSNHKEGSKNKLQLNFKIEKITEYILRANIQFRILWDMRLFGRTTIKSPFTSQFGQIGKENWSVVKALTRRIVSYNEYEYRHLKPVSELSSYIATELSCFFSDNILWNNYVPLPADSIKVLDRMRFDTTRNSDLFVFDSLIRKNIHLWENAYQKSGTGSATQRANVLNSIFNSAVPIDLSCSQWNDLELHYKGIIQKSFQLLNNEIETGKISFSDTTKQDSNVTKVDEKSTKQIVQYIVEILIKNDLKILNRSKLFIGLLDDYCKNSFEPERKKIILSINEGIPERILSESPHLSEELIISKFSNQLTITGISNEFAEWIVKCWIISYNVYNEFKEKNIAKL